MFYIVDQETRYIAKDGKAIDVPLDGSPISRSEFYNFPRRDIAETKARLFNRNCVSRHHVVWVNPENEVA